MKIPKFIFLHTILESGSIRVRPMEGQKDLFGDNILDANVMCEKQWRNATDIGTAVCVAIEQFKTSPEAIGAKLFYKVMPGNIHLLGHADAPVTCDIPLATPEMEDAYKEYRKQLVIPKPTTFIGKMMQNPSYEPPSIDKNGFYVNSSTWYYLLRNARQQIPSILVGETGTGKTELVKMIARVLKKPFYKIDMGTLVDVQSGLIGTHKFKDGESKITLAPFIKFIQEPCIILLDEINRAPIGTSNILLPVLDDGRKLSVEISEESRVVDVHPDCVFIATANVGIKYNGTRPIDRALTDRFRKIELDQLPPHVEKNILVKRCHGIEEEDAEKVSTLIDVLREEYRQGRVQETVSIRYSLDVANLIVDGYSIEDAFELAVLPLYDNEGADSERSMVRQLINSK